jgi:enediyne biosynthesis protein E4
LLLGDGKGSFTAKRGSEIGFYAAKDAKKLITITTNKKDYYLVGNNNDALQFFELQK